MLEESFTASSIEEAAREGTYAAIGRAGGRDDTHPHLEPHHSFHRDRSEEARRIRCKAVLGIAFQHYLQLYDVVPSIAMVKTASEFDAGDFADLARRDEGRIFKRTAESRRDELCELHMERCDLLQ